MRGSIELTSTLSSLITPIIFSCIVLSDGPCVVLSDRDEVLGLPPGLGVVSGSDVEITDGLSGWRTGWRIGCPEDWGGEGAEVGSVTLFSGVTVRDEADISCSSAALCNIISLSNKPVCWINSSFNVRTVSSKL